MFLVARAVGAVVAGVVLPLACVTTAAAQTTHPGDVFIQGDLTIQVPMAPPGAPNLGKLYVEEAAVIDGKMCLGNSCSMTETYTNDISLRLKYVNNSIEFLDTSSSTNPNRDWIIRVNDDSSFAGGGIEKFAIEDTTAGTTPFTIAGGVPNNAFWLDTSGNVGLGTSLPSANLHIVGAEPKIVVEQSGSAAVREMFKMSNNGGSYFTLDNTAASTSWYFLHENASPNRFIISDAVNDGPEMSLTAEGVLTVQGGFVAAGTTLNVPDYVFDEGYELRPLADVGTFVKANGHLPDVQSAAEIASSGLDVTAMQMALLKKVEELTLYTLAQENVIAELRHEVKAMAEQIEQMR